MNRRVSLAVVAAAAVLLGGCDLDLNNPNAPTEATVLNDAEGVISLAVGLQSQMAGSMLAYVRAPALLSDEWAPGPRALADIRSLFAGDLDPSFGIIGTPYQATFRIFRTADNLIANAGNVGLPAPTATGIVALAKLHKAMALGYAYLHYRELPTQVAFEGAVPQPRAAVLAEVISLLRSAEQDLAGVTDAQLATFRNRVLDANFDLRNTVQAMLARYLLLAGDNAGAIQAADRVNLGVRSAYSFTGGDRNPVQNYAFGLEYVAPLMRFAREAEPGDRRVGFWMDTTRVTTIEGNAVGVMAAYSGIGDPFPVYLPGEMLLIKAEAYARQDNLAQAISHINQVRTQCTSPVNEPVACLPAWNPVNPTREMVLGQIARERRYELFQQGLRWEDLRRLGQFEGRQPKAEFLPIPQSECFINPNITC